jgi:hypothetical protein
MHVLSPSVLILVLAPNQYFEGTAYHELQKGNNEAKKNKLSDATWMLPLLFTCIEKLVDRIVPIIVDSKATTGSPFASASLTVCSIWISLLGMPDIILRRTNKRRADDCTFRGNIAVVYRLLVLT